MNRQPGEIEAGDAALGRKFRRFLLVPTRDGRIEVHLDSWANLVLHTASLYELFDGQGRDYAMRDDAAARAAVRPDLLAAFGGKDRRYSRHGTVNVVAPAMLAVAKRAGVGDLADFAIPAVDEYLAGPARDFEQLIWHLNSRSEPVRRRVRPSAG